MGGVFVSPGVYVLEQDLSDYVPALASSIFGVVGAASWGPINVLTDTTNENSLVNTFGAPALGALVDTQRLIYKPLYPAIIAMIQYLRQGQQGKFVRVSDGTDAPATAQLPDNGTPAVATGTIDVSGTKDLSVDHLVNVSVNGGPPVLVDLRQGAVDDTQVTAAEMLTALQNQLISQPVLASLQTVGAAKYLALTTTTGGSTKSIVFTAPPGGGATPASLDSAAGPFNLQFIPSPQLSLKIDGGAQQDFAFTGVSAKATTSVAPFNLAPIGAVNQSFAVQVKLPGQTGFFTQQTITFDPLATNYTFASMAAATNLETAAAINAQAVGFYAEAPTSGPDAGKVVIATDKEGSGAQLNLISGSALTSLGLTPGITNGTGTVADLSAVSTADVVTVVSATILNATCTLVSNLAVLTTASVGATSEIQILNGSGMFAGTVFGSAASATADATGIVFFSPLPPYPITYTGSGPLGTVLVTALYSGTRGNTIAVKVGPGKLVGNKYTVNVNGLDAEVFDNVVRLPTTGQTDITMVVSSWITLAGLTGPGTSTNNPATGTYPLTGGSDGMAGLNAGSYIGSIQGNKITGLQLFKDGDAVDVNILAVPGDLDNGIYPGQVGFVDVLGPVEAALDEICSGRGDCMFVIDPPLGLQVDSGGLTPSVVDWHNGQAGYNHAAFNTSYGATYWSHVEWYDNYSQANIWASPSGFAAQAYAFTDFNADPWFAPAGYVRGVIKEGLAVEHSPDQGQRDNMYSGGNSVNPIVNFHSAGIIIFGQRTLQRQPTALDRINVRRLMLYLRKVIATSVKRLLFEPNDKGTWTRFINLVEPFMRSVQARRGVTDFKVIMDETTNTPDVINRNEMHGRILLIPTKAAEVLVIEFTLLPTGATFAQV
jgi:phage tail sheath protein FI